MNGENEAQRGAQNQGAALEQYGREFSAHCSGFDSFMDGVNRIPRPALVFGILAMFVAAMADPV